MPLEEEKKCIGVIFALVSPGFILLVVFGIVAFAGPQCRAVAFKM
jgi:hypothetical protein